MDQGKVIRHTQGRSQAGTRTNDAPRRRANQSSASCNINRLLCAGKTVASSVNAHRLFDAILDQVAADFDVMREWRAGTQFPQPLSADQIRKFPEAEC